jgi:outer membrane protein
MNSIKAWFAIAMVACASLVFGQGAAQLPADLSALIAKAMDNYPKLKEGGEYVKLSEAKTELAYGSYMPIISADASYRYAKPTPKIDIPIPGYETSISFIPANNYDFNVKVIQPIWDFGRTGAVINRTKSETVTSRDNLENSKTAVAYQVAQLYMGILFINKSLDVQQQEIKLLEANEKLISDKIKNGDALKFDLLSTQVKKNIAQNRLVDLNAQLRKQYQLLNMFTGNTDFNYVTTSDININLLSAETVAPDNNIDVKVIQDRLTSNAWDVKIAKRGWLPSLVLSAQAGYKNGFVPDINKLLFNYGVGVGLNVPIFNSARPNYQTKIAKISQQANVYALEGQKISLNRDILQAQTDIAASQEKLTNYDLQVNQAEEALKLADVRYKAGIITSLELLTAQTNLQDVQLGKIQFEYNLLLSKLELNRLGSVKFW